MSSSPKFDPTVRTYICGPGTRDQQSKSIRKNGENKTRERSRSRDRVKELTDQVGNIGLSTNPLKTSFSTLRVNTGLGDRFSRRRPYVPNDTTVDSLTRNLAAFSLTNPNEERYPGRFKQSALTSPISSSESDSDDEPPTLKALETAAHPAQASAEPPAHQYKSSKSNSDAQLPTREALARAAHPAQKEDELDLTRFPSPEGRLSDTDFQQFGELVAAILYNEKSEDESEGEVDKV
jgi:hypothetical protein